jgi:hypothetical protein
MPNAANTVSHAIMPVNDEFAFGIVSSSLMQGMSYVYPRRRAGFVAHCGVMMLTDGHLRGALRSKNCRIAAVPSVT